MIEVQILIPLSDNAGRAFEEAHHEAFEAELVRLFGGCSRLSGLIAGWWEEGGQVYHDQNRVYAVFIPGLFDSAAKLMAAVALAKTHYSQLKVSVRYLGHAEII